MQESSQESDSVIVQNLTNRPVIVMLNSGRSLHLAPRTKAEPLPAVEIINNDLITKLVQRRILLLDPVGAPPAESPASAEEAAPTGKPSTRSTRPTKA